MALTLGDNFSYQGAKPLDARLKYDTLASMKAVADSTMYDGCLAYCTATDKTYQWKSTNTVDTTTGKWREFTSGGGGGGSYTAGDGIDITNDVISTDNLQSGDIAEIVSDLPGVTQLNLDELGDVDLGTLEDGNALVYDATNEKWVNGQGGGGGSYTAGDGIIIEDGVISVDPLQSGDMGDVIPSYPTPGGGGSGGSNPVGTVISFFGETAPDGYLVCDGSEYSKSTYTALSSHLLSLTDHSAYEVSGDATKFKVPDLRGEFLRGTGTNGHTNNGNGAAVGIHQDGTVNPSIRTFTDTNGNVSSAEAFVETFNEDLKADDGNKYPTPGAVRAYQLVTNRDYTIPNDVSKVRYNIGFGGATRSENRNVTWDIGYTSRPTNTSVLYCIKY